jgi:hypothetical protein
MWSMTYANRLLSWSSLRETVEELPSSEALQYINSWWFDAPWHPYGLHWDDFAKWPDPWALLEDSALCPVARALGIVYTISMLDRDDLNNIEMILTDTGETLVVSNDLILNWDKDAILNTNSNNIKRRITIQEVRSLYS